MDLQKMVENFHKTFGHPAPDSPRPLPQERVALRIALIREEFEEELIPALESGDILESYDAALDILYVTYGLLVEMGIDARPGFEEVQWSNMSKLGSDGLPVRSRGMGLDGLPEGKIMKGPNYFKPNLKKVLVDQGYKPNNCKW